MKELLLTGLARWRKLQEMTRAWSGSREATASPGLVGDRKGWCRSKAEAEAELLL